MTIELLQRLEAAPSGSHGGDLYCSGCGYGIVARTEPPRCPMCGGQSWLVRGAVAAAAAAPALAA
jgi:rubrerythrin